MVANNYDIRQCVTRTTGYGRQCRKKLEGSLQTVNGGVLSRITSRTMPEEVGFEMERMTLVCIDHVARPEVSLFA